MSDLNDKIEEEVCDLFDFSGCGAPHKLVIQLRDYLRYYSREDKENLEWCKDEWLWIAYLCDREELTDHGSSIGYVWLTDKGKQWLNKLNRYEE